MGSVSEEQGWRRSRVPLGFPGGELSTGSSPLARLCWRDRPPQLPAVDPGNIKAHAPAEVDCRGIQAQVICLRPEVELISLRAASEAAVGVVSQVDREHPACAALRAMHRTSATALVAPGFRRHETKQLQDVLHGHGGADRPVVNAWHGNFLCR